MLEMISRTGVGCFDTECDGPTRLRARQNIQKLIPGFPDVVFIGFVMKCQKRKSVRQDKTGAKCPCAHRCLIAAFLESSPSGKLHEEEGPGRKKHCLFVR